MSALKPSKRLANKKPDAVPVPCRTEHRQVVATGGNLGTDKISNRVFKLMLLLLVSA